MYKELRALIECQRLEVNIFYFKFCGLTVKTHVFLAK